MTSSKQLVRIPKREQQKIIYYIYKKFLIYAVKVAIEHIKKKSRLSKDELAFVLIIFHTIALWGKLKFFGVLVIFPKY